MIAIDYNIVHAEDVQSDVRRRIGAGGPWDISVLNGLGRTFEGHGAGAFSLKWMAKGRARYQIDRRSQLIASDCAILLDRDAPYRVSFDGATDSESYCLFFAPQLVAEAWASVEAGFAETDEPVLREVPSVPFAPTADLVERLWNLCRTGIGADPGQLEAQLLVVLGSMVTIAHRHRSLARRVPASKSATRAHLVQLLERAREMLLDTRGVGWTLERLASEVGLSRFHLLRLFRGVYGLTPMEYAEVLRMRAAAKALRATDRPIGELAGRFGYDSASAFAKAFRRQTGVAPTEWRSAPEN